MQSNLDLIVLYEKTCDKVIILGGVYGSVYVGDDHVIEHGWWQMIKAGPEHLLWVRERYTTSVSIHWL